MRKSDLSFPPRSCRHDVLSPAHTYRARWRNDLQCWTSVCYALGSFVFSGTFGFEPCQSVLLRIALFVGDYCWSTRFGWACGRLAGPLLRLAVGAAFTGASVALVLYAPANYVLSCLGMLTCGLFSAAYALTFVVAGSWVRREYSGTAFGFANMIIIGVGGLLLQPLIGIFAQMREREVPDADSLSILIWAQGLALVLLIPLILRSAKNTARRRNRRWSDSLLTFPYKGKERFARQRCPAPSVICNSR